DELRRHAFDGARGDAGAPALAARGENRLRLLWSVARSHVTRARVLARARIEARRAPLVGVAVGLWKDRGLRLDLGDGGRDAAALRVGDRLACLRDVVTSALDRLLRGTLALRAVLQDLGFIRRDEVCGDAEHPASAALGLEARHVEVRLDLGALPCAGWRRRAAAVRRRRGGARAPATPATTQAA